MTRSLVLLVLVGLVALSFAPQVAAFGAGNIPSYSHLEDRAFRHGDIEDIIEKLFKAAGGGFLSRGSKFSPLDVKRVYFGNWLRDYSQAVDVAGLSKTNLQTIINVCMVLGFLAHGYATAEFEVTPERLGCYLPTEHIDNPKGYAEGEDARKYDRRLRGPVDPQELQIDPQTGMKNYIANENGHWDTSKALVRRKLQECIDYGRRYKSSGNSNDQYEAFRLLGTALHTLEDFSAHSNFCELALISMGHQNVFAHVGRNVKVRAPNGRDVYPIVTGTFGGADFVHSLMGEATDHLSQASVSDLTQKVNNARSVSDGQSASSTVLRSLFLNIPGGDGEQLTREMDNVSNMRAGQPGGVDPSQMSPQELHDTLWKILSFRDSVMKKIEITIDKIPGLSGLVEKISNNVSVFIITTLEPFVKPLIGTAVGALGQTSQAVIDSHDQEEVWNDFNASDPTHSFLSKDHFALILNQPAGEVAKTIVEFTVNLVVKAWDDPSMPPHAVTEPVLECLFHPDFVNPHSQIQRMMLDKMRAWFDGCGRDKQEILNRLTPDSVRAHRNKRLGDNSDSGGGDHNHGSLSGGLQGVLASHNVSVPGASILNSAQDLMGGKMPWQQGFGSGGAQAWRGMDDNDNNGNQGGYNPPQQQHQYNAPPPQQHYNAPPPQQDYSSYGDQGYQQQHQQPPQQHYNQGGGGYEQGGGYGHHQQQQQQYGGGGGGYDQGQGYGHQGGGYGGPPQGYDQGPPQGQWGGQQGGYHHQPPPNQGGGGWGPPGGYR